jgi:hypothetical protein
MIIWRRPPEAHRCTKCDYCLRLWYEECRWSDCQQPHHGESKWSVVAVDWGMFTGVVAMGVVIKMLLA